MIAKITVILPENVKVDLGAQSRDQEFIFSAIDVAMMANPTWVSIVVNIVREANREST